MDTRSRRGQRGSVYVTRACGSFPVPPLSSLLPAHAQDQDSCKRRKVKCDAEQPCASCCVSNVHCSYTILPQKRGRVSRQTRDARPVSSPLATNDSDEAAVILMDAFDGGPMLTVTSAHSSPALTTSSTPHTNISWSAYNSSSNAQPIRTRLLEHVGSLLTSETTEDFVDRCIDLFMQFIFPNTPVCHESTLRAGVALFRPEISPDATPYPSSARAFTLVTAVCAFVISVAPDSYIPHRSTLALVFLRASRAMLLTYLEHDLEHPDWTSLVIRIWHSSATQNATGRNGEAFHYYHEACMLALRLRLYEELSVSQKPPLEAQLLRSIFWQLYLSDKSAVVLDDRCPIIVEHVFPGMMTLLERGSPETSLLDLSRYQSSPLLETRFQEGHVLKRQMWRDAVTLISAIKNGNNNDDGQLTELCLNVTSFMDGLPWWLWSPDHYLDEKSDLVATEYLTKCFWVQRSSITTAFHTLKLVILQACVDHDVPSAMGLDSSELSCLHRKMDISRDFLGELQMVPFDCIKMQGEPMVQRLRKVGTCLLEVVQNANNNRMKARAQSQLDQLLDVLAKLDSRASDGLQ